MHSWFGMGREVLKENINFILINQSTSSPGSKRLDHQYWKKKQETKIFKIKCRVSRLWTNEPPMQFIALAQRRCNTSYFTSSSSVTTFITLEENNTKLHLEITMTTFIPYYFLPIFWWLPWGLGFGFGGLVSGLYIHTLVKNLLVQYLMMLFLEQSGVVCPLAFHYPLTVCFRF